MDRAKRFYLAGRVLGWASVVGFVLTYHVPGVLFPLMVFALGLPAIILLAAFGGRALSVYPPESRRHVIRLSIERWWLVAICGINALGLAYTLVLAMQIRHLFRDVLAP